MADIIPPGFAEVTMPILNGALTRAAAVVFGVTVPSGGELPDDLAANVQAAFSTHLGPRFDSGCTIGPATVVVGQDGGENIAGSATSTQSGGLAISSPSPNVAVLLKKRSGRGGRRGRGRMYMPWFVAEGDVDEGGRITPSQVTNITAAATAFRNALSAADRSMVILHSAGATAPGSPDVVTSLVCDPFVATQRRRLVRGV